MNNHQIGAFSSWEGRKALEKGCHMAIVINQGEEAEGDGTSSPSPREVGPARAWHIWSLSLLQFSWWLSRGCWDTRDGYTLGSTSCTQVHKTVKPLLSSTIWPDLTYGFSVGFLMGTSLLDREILGGRIVSQILAFSCIGSWSLGGWLHFFESPLLSWNAGLMIYPSHRTTIMSCSQDT